MNLLSDITRGFSEEIFWKEYQLAQSSKGIIKTIYTFLYMRMATKRGGYIGRETKLIGPLHLPHGFNGVHIARDAVIGRGCTIYQNVTIGNAKEYAPHLGDNVVIGANAVLIGNIEIGDNVTIGAGAVVLESVPADCVVVGNASFRIIQANSEM